MFLTIILLWFMGLSFGGVIAAGIFAFLAIIGVYPRLIGVTHTRKRGHCAPVSPASHIFHILSYRFPSGTSKSLCKINHGPQKFNPYQETRDAL